MSLFSRSLIVVVLFAICPAAAWAQRFVPIRPTIPVRPTTPVPGYNPTSPPRFNPTPVPRFVPVPAPVFVPGHGNNGVPPASFHDAEQAVRLHSSPATHRIPDPEPRFVPEPAPRNLPMQNAPAVAGGNNPENDAYWTYAAIGVSLFVFGIVILVWIANAKAPSSILITSMPPGEAPNDIRMAWVGLTLPLLPGETGPKSIDSVEVLSMQSSGAAPGYVVDCQQALEVLAATNPVAAAWWRENCAAFLESNGSFLFPADHCQIV